MSELEYPQQANQQTQNAESYKQYILTIGLTALVSWAAWGMVVAKLDPYESTSMAMGLFFISLFFAFIGTFTLIGFGLRRWIGKAEVYYHHLSVSLRQGMLLSLCTLLCISFLIMGVLKWWNGLMLVTIAVLVELYITSRA
jgi:hypothetical protein